MILKRNRHLQTLRELGDKTSGLGALPGQAPSDADRLVGARVRSYPTTKSQSRASHSTSGALSLDCSSQIECRQEESCNAEATGDAARRKLPGWRWQFKRNVSASTEKSISSSEKSHTLPPELTPKRSSSNVKRIPNSNHAAKSSEGWGKGTLILVPSTDNSASVEVVSFIKSNSPFKDMTVSEATLDHLNDRGGDSTRDTVEFAESKLAMPFDVDEGNTSAIGSSSSCLHAIVQTPVPRQQEYCSESIDHDHCDNGGGVLPLDQNVQLKATEAKPIEAFEIAFETKIIDTVLNSDIVAEASCNFEMTRSKNGDENVRIEFLSPGPENTNEKRNVSSSIHMYDRSVTQISAKSDAIMEGSRVPDDKRHEKAPPSYGSNLTDPLSNSLDLPSESEYENLEKSTSTITMPSQHRRSNHSTTASFVAANSEDSKKLESTRTAPPVLELNKPGKNTSSTTTKVLVSKYGLSNAQAPNLGSTKLSHSDTGKCHSSSHDGSSNGSLDGNTAPSLRLKNVLVQVQTDYEVECQIAVATDSQVRCLREECSVASQLHEPNILNIAQSLARNELGEKDPDIDKTPTVSTSPSVDLVLLELDLKDRLNTPSLKCVPACSSANEVTTANLALTPQNQKSPGVHGRWTLTSCFKSNRQPKLMAPSQDSSRGEFNILHDTTSFTGEREKSIHGPPFMDSRASSSVEKDLLSSSPPSGSSGYSCQSGDAHSHYQSEYLRRLTHGTKASSSCTKKLITKQRRDFQKELTNVESISKSLTGKLVHDESEKNEYSVSGSSDPTIPAASPRSSLFSTAEAQTPCARSELGTVESRNNPPRHLFDFNYSLSSELSTEDSGSSKTESMFSDITENTESLLGLDEGSTQHSSLSSSLAQSHSNTTTESSNCSDSESQSEACDENVFKPSITPDVVNSYENPDAQNKMPPRVTYRKRSKIVEALENITSNDNSTRPSNSQTAGNISFETDGGKIVEEVKYKLSFGPFNFKYYARKGKK